MATVYIAPTAQGSADGTSEANAYAFSSLATAENDAGSGGTLYFLDGTYPTGNQTFDTPGLTYKSFNLWGAKFGDSSKTTNAHSVQINVGNNTVSESITFSGFYLINARILSKQQNDPTFFNYIENCKIESTDHMYYNNQGTFSHVGSGTNSKTKITGCVIVARYSTSSSDSASDVESGWEIERCSWYLSRGANTLSLTSLNNFSFLKNCIFYGDTATTFSGSFIASCTNCCLHEMDVTSGGTDNIFADPQFVDLNGADLRLRPTSPCLGAGTAS